jgi:hypothetical protein
MDLTSKVNQDAEIDTRGFFDISLDGGYKYHGKLLFQYYNLDLEENSTQDLVFDGAHASVRGIFDFLDITYWTGYYGLLGEGNYYKGYIYHNREPGFEYLGYYPVYGTGLNLTGHFSEIFSLHLFGYQRYGNSSIDSADVNISLQKDSLTFNIFSGLTSDQYRLGAQVVFLGQDIDLYLTIGDPTIEGGRELDFDDFYFLIEEWFRLKNWNLILSVFTRPALHYNYLVRDYIDTNQTDDIDFNLNINYSPKSHDLFIGNELNIRSNTIEDFGITISPYISFLTFGVLWKIKFDFTLLSDTQDFFTSFVNINTSF